MSFYPNINLLAIVLSIEVPYIYTFRYINATFSLNTNMVTFYLFFVDINFGSSIVNANGWEVFIDKSFLTIPRKTVIESGIYRDRTMADILMKLLNNYVDSVDYN